jgi:hypothetical protein
MRDLRTGLERIAERAKASPDAFERLERARRRYERNRRITAGGVALLVAVAGSFAAFTAFRTESSGQTIGSGGSGFFSLWPEQTEEGLTAAQEAVDRADPDLAWRSDPIEVARRFALEELLWPEVAVEPAEGFDVEIEDVISLDLSVPPGLSCDLLVTDAECPTTRTTVTMQRLGRQDGLWSIVEIHGEDLALPVVPGDVVSAGTSISVPTNLPDGESVSMGVALLAACDRRGPDDNVEASGGILEFDVPPVPEGCEGYIYAMRPPTGAGAVAIGSFLLTDAEAVPAIGYLVQEIAAVPVSFANQAASDLAEFACDASGSIAPSSSAVAAQPDGVHIAITNTGYARVMYWIDGIDGDGAEPGERNETVWQLQPGTTTVVCGVVSGGGTSVASSASLKVVDPEGSYVPADLDCPDAASSQISDYVEGAVGVQGDPVEVARQHLSGLEFDDQVDRAGYPESDHPVVRVVRDGDVVASATFLSDGQGGWLIETLDVCYGVPIAWSEGTTGVSGPMGPTNTAWDALCDSARAGEGNNIHNGPDLHVDGRGLDFDTGCLIAPAGTPLTILLSNLDAGVHMNISIYGLTPYLRECLVTGTSPSGKVQHRIFSGEIILGVDEIVYEVGPLEPGAYYFQDDVHPSANGVLVIE